MKTYFIIVNLIMASFAFSYLVGAVDPSKNNPLGGVGVTAASSYGYSESSIFRDKDEAEWVFEQTYKDGKLTYKVGKSSKELVEKSYAEASKIAKENGVIITQSAKTALQDTLTASNTKLGSFTAGQSLENGISVISTKPLEGGDIEVIFKDAAGKTETFTGDPDSLMSKTAANKFATTVKPGSQLSGLLPAQYWGTIYDGLLSGVQWAAVWYGIGQMIGSVAGMDKAQQKALSTSFAAGSFTYNLLGKTKDWGALKGIFGKEGSLAWLGKHPFISGLGVSIVTFVLLYKKESKEIVTFTCLPWQAPTGSRGGNDCEKCNTEEVCSEYRCKSLGQACQLLNAGTEDEKCDWVNPQDTTSPVISLWEEVLTEGYEYEPDNAVRPPARGVKILREGADNCVKAFTPLEFGIITDEPAQCRIDYNHTLKFDDMAFYFGESNLFSYNHSQRMSLPSPSSIEAAAPELQHDGTYTLYARCQDANENANVDEFSIRFCVEAGPDTTPPEIKGTSIANNMPVKYNQSALELEVYINEPAGCRWSREDRSYDNLENEMTCSKNVWEMNNNLVYTCKTELTGIKNRQENKFYFRCKDQPWQEESERNANQQGYAFTLIGTESLNIIDVKPNGTVKGSTDFISVWLEVETANGYKNGEAVCSYSETGSERDWIEFYETGTELHKQRLDLAEDDYKYYIKCVDLGGNRDDNSTEFKVEVDTEAPIIARAYKENELLKIITTEDSDCKYSSQSCNFKFEDGIDMPYANQTGHVAEWKTDTSYYIRCSDKYGNMPLSNACSMIVRPYNIVKQKSEG